MSADGKWKVTLNTPMGSRDGNLELASAGSSLSGTWSGPQGSQSFSDGKVEGNDVEWTVNVSGAMGQMALVFKGKVEGDNLNGTVQFGSFGSGTFAGARE